MTQHMAYIGLMDQRFLGIIIDLDMEESMFRKYVEFASLKGEQEKKFVRATINELGKIQAGEFVSRATALQHELKHFHDMLLSPFGATLFRLYFNIYANYQGLIIELLNRGCTNIGFPIVDWVNTEASVLSKYGLSVPTKEICKFTSKIAEYHKAIRQICSVEDTAGFNWIQMLESAAFNVQAQSVWNIYGEQEMRVLSNYISEAKDLKERYLTANHCLEGFLDSLGSALNGYIANTIYFLSLCGLAREDYPPQQRASSFLLFLKKMGGKPTEYNIDKFFDEYLHTVNLESVEEALTKSQQLNKAMLGRRKSKLADLPKEYIAALTPEAELRILEQYIEARQVMIKAYLDNPQAYHDPQLYRENLNNYVIPQIFLTSKRGIVWDKNLEKEFTLLMGREIVGGGIAAHVFRQKFPGIGIPIFTDENWTHLFIIALSMAILTGDWDPIPVAKSMILESIRNEGLILTDMVNIKSKESI